MKHLTLAVLFLGSLISSNFAFSSSSFPEDKITVSFHYADSFYYHEEVSFPANQNLTVKTLKELVGFYIKKSLHDDLRVGNMKLSVYTRTTLNTFTSECETGGKTRIGFLAEEQFEAITDENQKISSLLREFSKNLRLKVEEKDISERKHLDRLFFQADDAFLRMQNKLIYKRLQRARAKTF